MRASEWDMRRRLSAGAVRVFALWVVAWSVAGNSSAQGFLGSAGGERPSYFELRALGCELNTERYFDDNIHRVAIGGMGECDYITRSGLELRPEIIIQESVKLMLGYGLRVEDYDRAQELDNCLNAVMISGGKSLVDGRLRFSVSEEWQFRRGPSVHYKYNAENLAIKGEWLAGNDWRLSGGFRHRYLDYLSEQDEYMGKSNFANRFGVGVTRRLSRRDRVKLSGTLNYKDFKHFVVVFGEDGTYERGDAVRKDRYAKARADVDRYLFGSLVLNIYSSIGRNNSNNLGFDYADARYGFALISERKVAGVVLMVVSLDYQRYERNYREVVPILPPLLENAFDEETDQNIFSFRLMKYLNDILCISAQYRWIERYAIDYRNRYRKNVISGALSYSR